MNSLQIEIGIADDHKLFRQLLVNALNQEMSMSVVLETDNGDELINLLATCKPNVLLLDIRMPKKNGIDTLKILHERHPDINVLMLTSYLDEVYVAESLQYGIYGYLTKNMDFEEILQAIKQVSRDKYYLTNLLGNQLFQNYLAAHQKNVNTSLPNFSWEEIRLLNLLKEERTTEEISDIMNLSKRSIELKRDKMKVKAKAKTIGGLLLHAAKRGIIE